VNNQGGFTLGRFRNFRYFDNLQLELTDALDDIVVNRSGMLRPITLSRAHQ
jgi:hypothetical protein